jgi:hypothetical protein
MKLASGLMVLAALLLCAWVLRARPGATVDSALDPCSGGCDCTRLELKCGTIRITPQMNAFLQQQSIFQWQTLDFKDAKGIHQNTQYSCITLLLQ